MVRTAMPAKTQFLVIIGAEFVAKELSSWGTPRLQFAAHNWQLLEAKRTPSCWTCVASMHIHRKAPPTNHGPAKAS